MRLALANVIPLAVWDLPVAGKLLQEWRHDTSFPARLATAIADLHAATPFAHVFLCGGAADATLAAALPFPVTLATDPFAAARAGAAARSALCADVGQTSLKLAHGDRVWRIPRDLARAPLRDDTPLAARDAARASTIAFLREHLAVAADRIVLGLPCEVDANGIPRSCTYCFRDPDPELVPTLTDLPCEVANDAELAALAALADPRVPGGTATLVLTIGFGVGGALIAD
jgi:hypothetical protein